MKMLSWQFSKEQKKFERPFQKFFKLFLIGISVFSLWGAASEAMITPEGEEGAAAAAAARSSSLPHVYAVYQQPGDECYYVPWMNLEKIRAMREGGRIVFQDGHYVTKFHSYAVVCTRVHAFDCLCDGLREKGGPYATYERTVRDEGIKSSDIFKDKDIPVDKMDADPLDRSRRVAYTPYSLKAGTMNTLRRLPLYRGADELYYYSHTSRELIPLPRHPGGEEPICEETDCYIPTTSETGYFYRFSPGMLEEMGLAGPCSLQSWIVTCGSPLESFPRYCLRTSVHEEIEGEYFDGVGAFRQMLFACGLNKDNLPFGPEDESLEASASREFRAALQANPRNPWAAINKDDFFEYHLARIFRLHHTLKAMAMESVNFFNNPWKFYQESFDLSDRSGRTLREKQRFLPGEDQMLAYYLSNQLKFLYAASISGDALEAVLDFEDEDEAEIDLSPDILHAIYGSATERKYGSGSEKYSFLDTWAAIRKVFIQTVIEELGNVDFVSFSGHGNVMSFDKELVSLQSQENRAIGNALGFVLWDSCYAAGLNPFYRKVGQPSDRLGL